MSEQRGGDSTGKTWTETDDDLGIGGNFVSKHSPGFCKLWDKYA